MLLEHSQGRRERRWPASAWLGLALDNDNEELLLVVVVLVRSTSLQKPANGFPCGQTGPKQPPPTCPPDER